MKYSTIFFLTLCVIANSLFAHQTSPTTLVTEKVEAYMKTNQVPGIAAALYYKGKGYLIHIGYARPAISQKVSESTLFELGSLGKTFTSTLLALSIIHNQINLNAPLNNYLSYLKDHPSNIGAVTLKSLATHTSGLPRVPNINKNRINEGTLLYSLQDWTPSSSNGTHYLYSNLGFDLLRFALADKFKTSYGDLLQKSLLQPLNMIHTVSCVPFEAKENLAQGFDLKGNPVHHTDSCTIINTGALHSTSEDMLKYLMANLGVKGPPDLMQAMTFAQKGEVKITNKMTQGLAWQLVNLNGVEIIDKNGAIGGFSTWIGMIPDKKIGLVLLSNKRNPRLVPLGRELLINLSRL